MTAYYSTYYPIIRHIQFCNSSLMITQHPCSCTYKGGMKDGSLNFLNIIVRALYPDTRTRPYEIRIYLHHSVLIALTASPFRPTRPPTVVGKVCLVTYLESGLFPLDALNPLLPGLEPGTAQLTLTELHCWC